MPPETPRSGEGPRFSIISAVYNVARYLDAFIDSVEAQTFAREDFEVVAVDDGSTDDSLRKLQEWAERRPGLVTVLTKQNGGQATARNLGLEAARGEWVTFPDPDDVIEPQYLSEVDTFLRRNPETELVATNRIMLDDATGVLTDNHPLHMHFRNGNRLRDIDHLGEYFHGSAPAAFFRLARLQEENLRFDLAVRPNFEDGHFCCRYVLAAPQALVGFVATARYHYRKRQDSSSTLQTSLGDADRYTKVLRNGYLALLRSSTEQRGAAPEWLQNYVLYELSWYFSSQEAHAGAVSAATGPVAEEFHELLGQIVTYLSDDVVESFTLRPLKPAWREILLHGYRDEAWHTPYVLLDRHDADQRLVRAVYHFTGELPQEQFLCRGEQVQPAHAKVRDLTYHERALVKERIVWLSTAGSLRVRLDGRDADLRFAAPELPVHTLRATRIRVGIERAAAALRPPVQAAHHRPSRADRLTAWLAGTAPVRRVFGGAWALMDRIHDADDSAERLFRYLRSERRDVNAWFVVESGTADWKKLRSEGYRRVVPHGSLAWKLLMANCRHLVSSHADVPVMRPPAVVAFTEPSWRFTFLQHGVIKDDLSQWLNNKHIDLFVTSTTAEHESIVGDGSPYTFTTKEAKLTGLPRFDRLLEKGRAIGPAQRDLVLVTPTWRNWLLPPLVAGSQRRSLQLHEFLASEYAQNWLTLLKSPELADVARREGLTIGFLPHPNIQPVLAQLELPGHVQALNFSDFDVQELIARARVMVTDYSSMAFNAAYIDRPSVYFQFDADRVLNGGHVGRRGYFDYERDGFGSVAQDLDGAVRAVVDTLAHGPSPEPTYQARIDEAFPLRDGRCCERVVAEIQASTRRVRLVEPTARTPAAGVRTRPAGSSPSLRRRVRRRAARYARRLLP